MRGGSPLTIPNAGVESPCGVAHEIQKPFYLKALLGSFRGAFLVQRHGSKTRPTGTRQVAGRNAGARVGQQQRGETAPAVVIRSLLLPHHLIFLLRIQDRSVG